MPGSSQLNSDIGISVEYQVTTSLNQNSDRFRELIEGLNVITYEFHLGEHRFIYVSRMAESILGYPAEAWASPGFWNSHLHPDDREWASEFSKHHTRILKDHEYEYRMIASDGSIKWFKDITTVNTENGVPKMLQGVLIDITDRKKTEDELLKTKDKYQTLVEQQTEMITRWLPDGTFTYVNDVFCNFFEKTREELIGKRYIPKMPAEDLERFRKFFSQLDKDNPAGHFTHRIIKPDGEIRWLRWSDTAIFDNEGNITEYQTVGRDITARMNAEEALRQSEAQLRLLFDNAPIGMAIIDLDKKFIQVNNAFCDIVGYSKDELLNRSFEDITHQEDIGADKEIFDKAVAGVTSNLQFEKRYIHKSGRIVFAEVHLNILKDSSGTPYQRIAQVVDITERKEAGEQLKQTQVRLSAILNNLPNVAIYEFGEDVNFVSENIMDILGYPASDFMQNDRLFGNLMIAEDTNTYNKKVNSWKKNGAKGVLSNEIRIRHKNDEIRWIEDHMYEVTPEKGKSYFSGIMIDISEQKKTREKIEETETRLSTILTNLPKVVIYQSGSGKDFISDNITDMIGYTPNEVLKENSFFGSLIHPDDFPKVNQIITAWNSTNEKGILVAEFRVKRKDGEYIWLEDHMYRVKTYGGESYLSGILIDVTERKITERKISQSLKEKELLLKEIHHRVKNNLQVVSSLLKLQSRYVKDNTSYDILLDSQNRVRSMALVHQKLYQSKDFSQIDFSEYIRELSGHLFNVFKPKSDDVEIDIKSGKINLSIDLAIPCGLIINELVSNSLKYAFTEGKRGKINIALDCSNNNSFRLVVSDNGVGLPENVNFRNTASLGLQLVNTLVGQIDGSIEMENHYGTSFKIIFENKVSKNRA